MISRVGLLEKGVGGGDGSGEGDNGGGGGGLVTLVVLCGLIEID